MSFFKNLKSKLLGSIKEDLNSALGGKRISFNSKIEGALDDLIAMKTGINISNVPSKISEEALMAQESRAAAEKNTKLQARLRGRNEPNEREILKFPTDDHRFIDNWIIFRTVVIQHMGVVPSSPDRAKDHKGNVFQDKFFGKGNYGVNSSETGEAQNSTTKEYTIALYFPTGIKDAVNVEYEQKEIGLQDILMDDLLSGEFGELFNSLQPAMKESFMKAKQAMVSFQAFQDGTVIDNPKFNTYQGVSFRDHSYTFNLNPYNEADAQRITQLIHIFKMMMLPMSSHENPRNMIMPAEWTIDFMGPILGHIEHPQNCFLKSCDVDYSGGKDMSFIESFNDNSHGHDDGSIEQRLGHNSSTMQHYPNGVTLSLTFQEILNLDRLRYVQRVSPYAMGAKQDTLAELQGFEQVLSNAMRTAAQNSPTEDGILNEHGYPDDYDPSYWPNTNRGLARRWNNLTPVEKNEWLRDNNYSFRYNEGNGTPDD